MMRFGELLNVLLSTSDAIIASTFRGFISSECVGYCSASVGIVCHILTIFKLETISKDQAILKVASNDLWLCMSFSQRFHKPSHHRYSNQSFHSYFLVTLFLHWFAILGTHNAKQIATFYHYLSFNTGYYFIIRKQIGSPIQQSVSACACVLSNKEKWLCCCISLSSLYPLHFAYSDFLFIQLFAAPFLTSFIHCWLSNSKLIFRDFCVTVHNK